ncbi:MAG: lysine transporter LysE [Capnocytophaga sp.]|nr:lysine transporter LysE [Capnocytophaga sp.]
MVILLIVIIGLLSSFVGVIPPGMLNMSVAKLSVLRGKKAALIFAGGASFIVFFQSFTGVYFAKYVLSHPDIEHHLRVAGAVIFVLLTLFFIFSGIKSNRKVPNEYVKSRSNHFMHGMTLSALNLFPIPYYAFVGFSLTQRLWVGSLEFSVFLFSIAAATGTFLAFLVYIRLFKKLEDKLQFITRNINFIIALITGTVAVISICKLL